MIDPTIIFIPIEDDEKNIAEEFYRKKLGLQDVNGGFGIPGNKNVVLRFRYCKDISKINLQFENASLFCTSIKTNMVSTCRRLIENGVNIIYLQSDPGGYFAIIKDPFGNKIEFTCDNWDDIDGIIYPFEWDFFRKLD